MALLTHERWTPAGRVLNVGTGQKVYLSHVGQVNHHVTGDVYRPYVWDAPARTARFADCELRMLGTGPELWRGAVRLARIIPQVETFLAGAWQRPVLTLARTDVTEIVGQGPTDFLEITLMLRSLVADFQLRFRMGGSHKIHLDHRIRARVAGRHRLVLDVPRDSAAQVRPMFGHSPEGPVSIPSTGWDFLDSEVYWRWHRRELDRRTLDTDTSRFAARLLEQDYAIDEEAALSPDTLGPTAIGNDADDGDENRGTTGSNGTFSSAGTYANGNLYLEDDNGTGTVRWLGLGWRAIDLNTTSPGVDSIDAGTQIVITNPGDNGTPTGVAATLAGVNAGGGTVWGVGAARPSQQTATAATVAVTGSAGNQTLAVTTIVNEWVITEATSYDGVAGEDMYFFFNQGTPTGTDFWSVTADYDGAGAGVEATLTIQYTPTAGADTLFAQAIC